jgi:hypothetical protein
MSARAKRHLIHEMEPLLLEAERAILIGDAIGMLNTTRALLLLVRDYLDKVTPVEMRDALNNPTALRIAQRLGVNPWQYRQ